jgi:hypothetical protein
MPNEKKVKETKDNQQGDNEHFFFILSLTIATFNVLLFESPSITSSLLI